MNCPKCGRPLPEEPISLALIFVLVLTILFIILMGLYYSGIFGDLAYSRLLNSNMIAETPPMSIPPIKPKISGSIATTPSAMVSIL